MQNDDKINKIAIVTYSLRIGGVENVIFNLGKSFLDKGYEVEIIETLEEGLWKKYFIENEFKVVSIVKNPFKTAFRHVRQIASYLNQFDIILLNDAPYAQSGLGLLRSDILVFPIMHLTVPSMAVNASGSKGQWNKIIAVSPLLKKFLLEQLPGLADDDIVCIANGIDTKEFVPLAKANVRKKNILYLGRISEEKGIRLLPGIINKIKDHPCFDHLDIYGSGALEKELKTSLEELSLLSIVNLKGPVTHETVNKIIPGYDILIMPSFKEGHPIVLLEAMSCGIIPVVTLLPGSTDMVVSHGVSGFLCESGNKEQFAYYLSKALEIDNLREMAKEARETIESKFSKEIMCNDYLILFDHFKNWRTIRSNQIDEALLGDYPALPYLLVRPVRKTIRTIKRLLN